MGFNLCFVKAEGKSDKVYYYAQYDEKIQWEQNKRKYIPLKFESPAKSKNVLSWFIPDRKNLPEGSNVNGELAVYSPRTSSIEFVGSVSTNDGFIPQSIQTKINVHEGFDYYPVSIPAVDIVEGGYNIRWRFVDDVIKIFPITILPAFSRKEKFEMLSKNSAVLSEGSKNTIIYRVNEIQESLDKIKPYENAGALRDRMLKLESDIKKIAAGEDPYKNKSGIFRRAYLSKIDNTYQPYSIKVPVNFNPSKKYPLFVLLHGSGQLDNGMLEGYDYTKGEFIEVAPSGRGTTNCYSADNAQDDIRECINDVIAAYNIDEKNIVLAGFSMGGYGVFRTYYETPDRYAGLAIFSGHPNLANKWLEGKHPDFTDAETLKRFKNIPMFIYHDKIDLNCPFDIMEGTVKNLQGLGADLKFVTSSGLGHNILNDSNREEFYSWLTRFSKK
jgi:predicted esterase